MTHYTRNQILQQSMLYVFVAVTTPLSSYIGLVYDGPNQRAQNLGERIVAPQLVWPMIFISLTLLVAATVSLVRPRLASKITLVTVTICLTGFLIVLFGWFIAIPVLVIVAGLVRPRLASRIVLDTPMIVVAGFLIPIVSAYIIIPVVLSGMFPIFFLAVGFPGFLLFNAGAYSRWMLQSSQANASVLFWIANRDGQGAGIVVRGIVVALMFAVAIQFVLQISNVLNVIR